MKPLQLLAPPFFLGKFSLRRFPQGFEPCVTNWNTWLEERGPQGHRNVLVELAYVRHGHATGGPRESGLVLSYKVEVTRRIGGGWHVFLFTLARVARPGRTGIFGLSPSLSTVPTYLTHHSNWLRYITGCSPSGLSCRLHGKLDWGLVGFSAAFFCCACRCFWRPDSSLRVISLHTTLPVVRVA